MSLANRLSALRVFGFYIAFPAVLVVGLSNFVVGSDAFIRLLSEYRPVAGQSTLEVNVARQVLFMDATLRQPAPERRVSVIGSSSVVNGVDADIVNARWSESAQRRRFVNLGQTGLVAYELALLKNFTLDQSLDTIVFLYNSFSFADLLLGTVVGARWNTVEMWLLEPPRWYSSEDWKRYATGFVNEHLTLLRYSPVLRNTAMRALRGHLVRTPYFPDFPPEPALEAKRKREAETPAPDRDWLRKAYLDSAERGDTLGYRGFERYLQLARERGIRVIVAPVPEPEFSLSNKWRIGADPQAVDGRVAQIAARHGAIVWSRDRMAPYEADDTLFRDPTHFNRFGRSRFSADIADWIVRELRDN